jgi:hypothetical protein
MRRRTQVVGSKEAKNNRGPGAAARFEAWRARDRPHPRGPAGFSAVTYNNGFIKRKAEME